MSYPPHSRSIQSEPPRPPLETNGAPGIDDIVGLRQQILGRTFPLPQPPGFTIQPKMRCPSRRPDTDTKGNPADNATVLFLEPHLRPLAKDFNIVVSTASAGDAFCARLVLTVIDVADGPLRRILVARGKEQPTLPLALSQLLKTTCLILETKGLDFVGGLKTESDWKEAYGGWYEKSLVWKADHIVEEQL
ncbi:hypothetical protein B0A50_05166 [Salinomyces thailandicus]|uniref:Uncharacterized protein n=1 Tax=Salinomyces thailandicus TaxID=706561 RepID=A0A4U0TYW8_9PEZI|nr:hypothetical protein B0A50_05166 [Salinomyces thailandica]